MTIPGLVRRGWRGRLWMEAVVEVREDWKFVG